jgi:hypothetical protein
MRLRRPAALVAAVLLCACDGSTSPAPTLEGVFAGRAALFDATDSLTLALAQDGSEVRGFGIHRESTNPRTWLRMYFVHGTVTGRSAELYLSPAAGLPQPTPVLRGTLNGGELSGTWKPLDVEQPVTMRRADPRGDGVAGTYALASTSGGVTLAARDTIVAFPDGRARRYRETATVAYGTLGLWSRRGDWLMLEQLTFSLSQIPFLDSLRVQSGTLVRTTRLFDGSMVVETYARVR